MSWHTEVKQQAIQLLSSNNDNEITDLNNTLRLLAKHRSILIQNTFIKEQGLSVLTGPLAGLDFISQSSEGCHVAKLLGTYEQPLQPFIQDVINERYDTVINIGCAEGYYAVGLARRMTQTKIFAFDIDFNAIETCKLLAKKNSVEDRVIVKGEFKIEELSRFVSGKTLIFCDIEGAENELLDPELSPSLIECDLILEAHENLHPGICSLMTERFKSTHKIISVFDNGMRQLDTMPDWFMRLAHLDQVLAVWEWRTGPTPWLVMQSLSN